MIDLAVLRQIINDNGLIIQVKNDNYDETECLMNIADDLELLLKPKNNGWISVDNDLPKTFTNVLVYSKLKINDELFDCVGIGYIDDENYWQYDETFGYHHIDPYFINEISSNDLTNVQYWQPLPEPPKE